MLFSDRFRVSGVIDDLWFFPTRYNVPKSSAYLAAAPLDMHSAGGLWMDPFTTSFVKKAEGPLKLLSLLRDHVMIDMKTKKPIKSDISTSVVDSICVLISEKRKVTVKEKKTIEDAYFYVQGRFLVNLEDRLRKMTEDISPEPVYRVLFTNAAPSIVASEYTAPTKDYWDITSPDYSMLPRRTYEFGSPSRFVLHTNQKEPGIAYTEDVADALTVLVNTSKTSDDFLKSARKIGLCRTTAVFKTFSLAAHWRYLDWHARIADLSYIMSSLRSELEVELMLTDDKYVGLRSDSIHQLEPLWLLEKDV